MMIKERDHHYSLCARGPIFSNNWHTFRYRYGGSAMFYRLSPKGGKLPGKIIVLTHDIAHRSEKGKLVFIS